MRHLGISSKWAFVLACGALSNAAWAKSDKAPAPATPAPEAAAAPAEEGAEDVDVEAIKKKYWATGNESEMGVVQNRLYSKAGKFQFGLSGGVAVSDPFLSIRPVGFSAGYHFSEYLGANITYWKFQTSPSSALNTLREGSKQANTVDPHYYWGTEASWSLLYGKLSLLGHAILYYDMYFTGGLGIMDIETSSKLKSSYGKPLGLTAGLGQRFYLNKWLSLKLDYHMLRYTEHIIQKEGTPDQIGTDVGTRANFTHTIMLGLDVLFGVF